MLFWVIWLRFASFCTVKRSHENQKVDINRPPIPNTKKQKPVAAIRHPLLSSVEDFCGDEFSDKVSIANGISLLVQQTGLFRLTSFLKIATTVVNDAELPVRYDRLLFAGNSSVAQR